MKISVCKNTSHNYYPAQFLSLIRVNMALWYIIILYTEITHTFYINYAVRIFTFESRKRFMKPTDYILFYFTIHKNQPELIQGTFIF